MGKKAKEKVLLSTIPIKRFVMMMSFHHQRTATFLSSPSLMVVVVLFCWVSDNHPCVTSFSGVDIKPNRHLHMVKSSLAKSSFFATSLSSLGVRHLTGSNLVVENGTRRYFIGSEAPSMPIVFPQSSTNSWIINLDDDDNVDDEDPSINFTKPLCRVVALSDGKLRKESVALLQRPPNMLEKLDAIFHAKAHDETRRFQYMQRPPFALNYNNSAQATTVSMLDTASASSASTSPNIVLQEEEENQFRVALRRGLEDAGFELLSKRDYDLCEALNAEYLLRLSILPDISQADPGIVQELYPERFDPNGTVMDREEILFDGRILIFWRGYNSEVTRGRLLLPKLDYLQANLVQRSAAYLAKSIGRVERQVLKVLQAAVSFVRRSVRDFLFGAIASIPFGRLAKFARDMTTTWDDDDDKPKPSRIEEQDDNSDDGERATRRFFRLARYGGSKIRFVGSPNPKDALNPFLICEVPQAVNPPCPNAHNDYLHRIEKSRRQQSLTDINDELYQGLQSGAFTCLYDEQSKHPPRATQLLERISIADVVDSFSHVGRARLLATFFSKSELVEPSFDEVVVVWRPLPDSVKTSRGRLVIPKLVYDLADIFDIDGLPQLLPEPIKPVPRPVEIRAFHRVPMANLLAVMPKTKLVFRPADAFVFDLISVISFALIIGSQRFDSPKLDFLALVSVALWIIRTFLRYRNKLTSYDLLVQTFLTSKISHRNAGAFKYVATEAGSQRAIRATLVYAWLVRRMASLRSNFVGNKPVDLKVVRTQMEREGETGVNELLLASNNSSGGGGGTDKLVVRVDMNAALNDLEELNLATFSEDKLVLTKVVEPSDVVDVLRETWTSLF